eukprot:scaffold96175_cov67-Phaeocystis_antarctica.AAC.2
MSIMRALTCGLSSRSWPGPYSPFSKPNSTDSLPTKEPGPKYTALPARFTTAWLSDEKSIVRAITRRCPLAEQRKHLVHGQLTHRSHPAWPVHRKKRDRGELGASELECAQSGQARPPADVLPPIDVGFERELFEVRAGAGKVARCLVAHPSVNRELFELCGDGSWQEAEVEKVVRHHVLLVDAVAWEFPELGVDRQPLEARGLGHHET